MEPPTALHNEGYTVRATQKTMKLIEDIWVAKSAHITHLEATQDRLTSESAKALLQKQINIRLHSTSEWMKKKWCSVN